MANHKSCRLQNPDVDIQPLHGCSKHSAKPGNSEAYSSLKYSCGPLPSHVEILVVCESALSKGHEVSSLPIRYLAVSRIQPFVEKVKIVQLRERL